MWLTIPGISCCSEAAGVLPVTCGPVAEWRRRDDASSRILVQVQAGPPSTSYTNPIRLVTAPDAARLHGRQLIRVNINMSLQFRFGSGLRKQERVSQS